MPARKIDRTAIARLHNQGLTGPAIAAQLHCSEHTIGRARKELGLSVSRPTISEERMERIKSMVSDGWSWAEIRRTEGVHRETMLRYFPGTQWTPEQMNEHRIGIIHTLQKSKRKNT